MPPEDMKSDPIFMALLSSEWQCLVSGQKRRNSVDGVLIHVFVVICFVVVVVVVVLIIATAVVSLIK